MRTLSSVLPQFPPHVFAERKSPPLLRERWVWVVITLFWTVLGIGSWLLEYRLSFGAPDGPMTLSRAAARLVYAVLWWVVTVSAIWISDYLTVRHPRQYLRMGFHVVVGAIIALGWAVLAYYINLAIIPGWLPLGVERMLNTTFLTSFFYYVGILCLVHGVIFAREYRSRELEARSRELEARSREAEALRAASLSTEAQLEILKMELQPHFLFNALHSISALMHRDVEAANEMLVLLADMLHAALDSVRDQQVSLEEEIATLQLYGQIQQIRFGDRLRISWRIEPDTAEACVPHMILQPLVENAIKHGLAHRAAGGHVEVSARRAEGWLRLTVRDDGEGLRRFPPGFGVGLSNVIARLVYLYEDKQALELSPAPGGGTVAVISIPFVRADTGNSSGGERERGRRDSLEREPHHE